MSKPKIVLWDLETLPNLPELMKRVPSLGNWPGRTMKAEVNSIICFGYKYLGDTTAQCINAWDFANWDEDVNDDSAICMMVYDILKDADAFVTHNGRKFDLKVLNTRLMKHGFPPIAKKPHIDTLVVARRLSLYSNRLGDVSKFFGMEGKLDNGGWDLWVEVMQRDKASQKLMTEYCLQDVEVLNQIYNELRPLITNIPNYNMFNTDDRGVCPNCGSHKLINHGTRVAKTRIIQRYLCGECGSVHGITKAGNASVEGV